MVGLGVIGAAGIRHALSRIRRLAPAPVPGTLPCALVADRLGALTTGADVDRVLEASLDGARAAAPKPVQDRPVGPTDHSTLSRPRTPPTVTDRMGGPAGTSGAAGVAVAPALSSVLRKSADRPAARSTAVTRMAADDRTDPDIVERSPSPRRRTGTGRPVLVQGDPDLAAALPLLAEVSGPQHLATGEPGALDRAWTGRQPTPVTPGTVPPTDGAVVPMAPRAGTAERPAAIVAPTLAAAGPAAHSAPGGPAWSEPPSGELRRADALPPVGLAGLVAWWEDSSSEPAAGPDASRTGSGPAGSALGQPASTATPSSGPWTEDEPPANLTADPLALFREALESVLLDEVLADGLEVSDGPA